MADGSNSREPTTEYPAIMREIGERVRAVREKLEKTQSELGEDLGVSRETINEIEMGRRKRINYPLLQKLAEKSKTPVRFFYPGDTPQPEEPPSMDSPVDTLETIFAPPHRDTQQELEDALSRLARLPERQQRRLGPIIGQIVRLFEKDAEDAEK